MFTQPVSSPPPVGPGASLTANNPSSSSRRLRGLSYLRNYTHNHLLSRDHNSHSSNTNNCSNQTSAATQTASSQQSSASRPEPIARSSSHSPASSPAIPGAAAESSTAAPAKNHPPTPPSSSPGAAGPRPLDTIADEPPAYSPGAAGNNMDATGSPPETNPAGATSASTAAAGPSTTTATPSELLPSIRFLAYFDPRATRPSLPFSPITRTLPTGTEKIRVGRYSERDAQPNVPSNVPSHSPVGFKSKVVSRRHCEFWCEGGKWFIKDVKSSSGTFLNHIRLSPPGTESKPFAVNDGDIVQLGIDFKGGEEMIFRCVKMRLELNRGWQNKPNAFNVTTHKRLRNLASAGGDSANTSQDCSICLNSIAPCQSLFVAPCSHTWHYKCIRSLLNSPQYPIFVCPNCRMAADLEADIEDPEENWDQVNVAEPAKPEDNRDANLQAADETAAVAQPAPPAPPVAAEPEQPPATRDSGTGQDDSDAAREVRRQSSAARLAHMTLIPHSVSQPLAIRPLSSMLPRQRSRSNSSTRGRTPSPPNQTGGVEGPITPRNDAGPWVFDGSAAGSRAASASEGTGMRSLDEAAELEAER